MQSGNEPTGLFYDPERPLSDAIDFFIDLHRNEREEHRQWRLAQLREDYKNALDNINTNAAALMRGAGELVSMEGQLFVDVLAGLEDEAGSTEERKLLKEALFEELQYLVGCDVVRLCEAAEANIVMLLVLGRRGRPSGRGQSFLKRVGRCYLYGFDAKCVVMCRSVLDAELEAEIAADDCIDILGADRRPIRDGAPLFDLVDRIAVAFKLARISAKGRDAATRVREDGNHAVHRKARVRREVSATVGETLLVIDELQASSEKR